MKRFFVALFIVVGLLTWFALDKYVAAQIPGCELVGFYQGKELYICDPPPTPTPIPTSTPTALPTSTPTPPSATPTATFAPSPTSTSNPSPTATPLPLLGKKFPPRAPDGTYYITQPGTYSDTVSCGSLPATSYCVHAWGSNIHLVDFSITTQSGNALQFDSNQTHTRGTITGGGAFAFDERNVIFDTVTLTTPIGGIGMGAPAGCENATPRPNSVTIRNSVIRNFGGVEMIWIKCGQDVVIEGNRLIPASDWAISTPDGVNIVIRNNTIDLSAEPRNWLAIELPRVFGVSVEGNNIGGPPEDWMVYVNSGTRDLTVRNNCSPTQILHTSHQSGGVQGLVTENNGPCATASGIAPPSTGSGGLRKK